MAPVEPESQPPSEDPQRVEYQIGQQAQQVQSRHHHVVQAAAGKAQLQVRAPARTALGQGGEVSGCRRIGRAGSRAFNLGKDPAAGGFHSSEISPRRSRFGAFGITTIPESVIKNRRRSRSRSKPISSPSGMYTFLSTIARRIRAWRPTST